MTVEEKRFFHRAPDHHPPVRRSNLYRMLSLLTFYPSDTGDDDMATKITRCTHTCATLCDRCHQFNLAEMRREQRESISDWVANDDDPRFTLPYAGFIEIELLPDGRVHAY